MIRVGSLFSLEGTCWGSNEHIINDVCILQAVASHTKQEEGRNLFPKKKKTKREKTKTYKTKKGLAYDQVSKINWEGIKY